MVVTKDVIKDIFYKMYFFLPDGVEDVPSYKNVFDEFWRKYDITDLNAQIKYSNSDEEVFSPKYFEKATAVDVSLNLEDSKLIEKIEEKITEDFKSVIMEIYRNIGEKRERINQYWKQHASELLFLITRRNNVENLSIKQEVQKSLSEFNDNALRFINELIQNADDCIYSTDFNIFTMLFDIEKNEIVISYPEEGFTYADIISLSSINETNKMTDVDKATTTIGEKGRGFKSIFVYFKEVEIESGGYHFKYNIDEASMFQPIYLGTPKQDIGTKLVLRLKDEIILSENDDEETRKSGSDIEKLVLDVKKFYGASNPQNLYRNNSIFFTRNFTELRIIFKDKSTSDIVRISNTHLIEDCAERLKIWWENPDGKNLHYCTGTMEYMSVNEIRNELIDTDYINKLPVSYKFNLIGLIKYIDYDQDIIQLRYGKVNEEQIADIKRTMPIIMFGIRDMEVYDEKYSVDIHSFSGHMYTYLPTSLNIRLPFIFQMPFDLEDNRSCPKSESRWNAILLDFVWNKKDSIIREWYEYVKQNAVVESVYSYLPTKKSTNGTFKNLAFYIDEEYNFDPLGGSKYAAYAKEQIDKFNGGNAERAKQLFESIEIFENLDKSEPVSLNQIKILDETLAVFDIDGENLFWKYYREKNSKLFRFIYSEEKCEEKCEEKSIAKKVIEFNEFLENETVELVLSWDSVASDEDIHDAIEGEMCTCGERKQFDKISVFSERFLDADLWLRKYGITDVAELEGDKILSIRKWGSGLLYFKVRFFDDESRWVRYAVSEEENYNLWLSTSKESMKSFHYEKVSEQEKKEIRISVICTEQMKENNIIKIFVNNNVDSYGDILSKIENWTEDAITTEEKLWIVGYYYLCLGGYDSGVNRYIISTLFNKLDDINDVIEFPDLPGIDDSKRVKWEQIRFLSWNAGNKKKKIKLNLRFISADIVQVINPVDEGKMVSNDNNIGFSGSICGRLVEEEERPDLDKFNSTYPHIYVNEDYFKYISERNFLKFPSQKCLILKSIEFLGEACESESVLPIEFIQGVKKRYDAIKGNVYEPKGIRRSLGIVKGIQAYQIFSLIDDNNYREVVGKEGIVYSELLQNVNDYANPGTGLAISIKKETDGYYWMTMVYEEKEHVEKCNNADVVKHGFLPSDILALISIGNSAKRAESNKYTGNKGIGFKNIYKIFDQVLVDSNGYKFLLDDSYGVDPERLYERLVEEKVGNIYLDKTCKVESILKKLKDEDTDKDTDTIDENGDRKKFPIIQSTDKEIDKSIFVPAQKGLIGTTEVSKEDLTAFKFRFRNEETRLSLQSQLRGSNKCRKNSYNMMSLFLHNLRNIYVEVDDDKTVNNTVLPICLDAGNEKTEYVESKFFWSNRDFISDLNSIKTKSPRYEKRKNTEEEGIFANVEVRFMKTPFLIDDSGSISNEGCLYVTLPTNISTGAAVHINIPALETTADRQDIILDDSSIEGQWNFEIINKVFGEDGVFVRMFNAFTEKYLNTIANYAFLYVPQGLYLKFKDDWYDFNSGFDELKFIPCMTSNGLKIRSLKEIKDSNCVYKLKDFMYQWFDLMDPDFSIFYQTSQPDEKNPIEFIYMKEQNAWGLIEEFEKSKYHNLQPRAWDYSQNDFFNYIAKYWKFYYDGIEDQDQKECDKELKNRIKLLTAKTGVENHYSKWHAWKEFYLKSLEGMSSDTFIDNMIKAVCFDRHDFKTAFYFTAKSIEKIVYDNNSMKVEIENSIVNRYKKYLMGKGYFDFAKYYKLLKVELLDCGVSLENDVSDENINKWGVKKLEDLLDEIPVLLMNNKFMDAEKKDFFVKLPPKLYKLFAEDSIDDVYKSLRNFWVDEGFVVSRANISSAENIYELEDIDREFDKLLPLLSDSETYLELIWKNKLLSEYMVKNILEFWKGKIAAGKEKIDYFTIYIDALSRITAYNHNIDVGKPEIDYDIELLNGNKLISDCNRLSKFWVGEKEYRNNILRINLDKNKYKSNPTVYWNEIEMDLTANQRKIIAEFDKEEKISPDEINQGIENFLKHIYICDENPSIYVMGQYLRVYINGEEAFVIFQDYTESLVLLLKEVFGIKLRKAKFNPFVNLYRYNDLLPIGTQEEYLLVRDDVFNTLKMQTEEAEIARIKLQLLSLQYQLNNNKMLAGYGMQCPLLKTKDVTELSSLQVFEYGLFGFRIGISLYGSKYAKDVIIKYASAVQVSIEKRNSKKRKTKEAPLFIVNNGKYIFDGQEIILQGIDIQKNNDLVIRMLDSLMSLLDDVQNNIILNIEMVTDSGAKKKERFQIQLTHCHRALMVYELGLAKEEFGKLYK